MIDVPCPNCGKRALSLDMHLRFDCAPLEERRGANRPSDEEFWGMREEDLAVIIAEEIVAAGPAWVR